MLHFCGVYFAVMPVPSFCFGVLLCHNKESTFKTFGFTLGLSYVIIAFGVEL